MKSKILIIDDDDLFLAMMQIRLEVSGFNVISCKTGEEGVMLFEQSKPELVVLDIRLPSMSSDEVFRRIKKLNSSARIITTSAYTSNTTADEEKNRGAESFYDKATQSENLVTAIKAALEIP